METLSAALFRPALPARIERQLARARERGFAMSCSALTGQLLRALVAAKRGAHVLDIGTGVGVSTSWMLDGADEATRIVTVEADETLAAVARGDLGDDARIRFVTGDAGAYLSACSETFDVIFADAWPGKFSHLDAVLALLRPGGVYVIDDLLPQPTWPAHHQPNVDRLIAELDRKSDLIICKSDSDTGWAVCVKRP